MPVSGSPPGRTGELAIARAWPLRRFQNALAAALLVGFMVMGWVGRGPLEIGAGDDLIYLSLSRSLESGSYREAYRASAPLHTKYPPAYPAWLLLVRRATGDCLECIEVANLVLVALALLLLFTAARRLAGGWFSLTLLLLMVLSHGVLWMGGSYYSEGLFLFLSTASLAAMLPNGSGDSRTVITAIALALLAFLTRLAGVAIIVAVGVWLWSRRNRIEMAVYALSSTLVVGGWFGYVALASSRDTVRSYASDFYAYGHSAAPGVVGPLTHLAGRVWDNALTYGTEVLPAEMSLLAIHGTRIDDWIWLCLDIVLLATGLVILWRGWRAAAAYLLAYAGVLLLWSWPIDRLLDPAVPLLLLTFLLGARRVAQRLPVRVRGPALVVFVTVLTLGAIAGTTERIEQYSSCDRGSPYASAGCYTADKRSLAAASDYLREHTPVGEVVLAWRPSDVQFLSGHLGEHAALFTDAPHEAFARELRDRNIRHVLLTPVFPDEKYGFARTLLASCREFRVEGRFPPHTLLLTILAAGETNPNACEALNGFVREYPDPARPAGA